MHVDLVIARYKENLCWLDNSVRILQEKGYNVTVYLYDKGDHPPVISTELWYETLPNVGRESHTYLHHIITHLDLYHSEPEHYVVFLQGSFMDHASLFYQGFSSPHELIEAFIIDAISNRCASLKWATTHEDVGWNAAHWNFRIAMHSGRVLSPLVNMPFGQWFVRNVYHVFPQNALLRWWVSALFCASSKLLVKRPRKYFENLEQQLLHLDPEVGHFMERSWVYIIGAF